MIFFCPQLPLTHFGQNSALNYICFTHNLRYTRIDPHQIRLRRYDINPSRFIYDFSSPSLQLKPHADLIPARPDKTPALLDLIPTRLDKTPTLLDLIPARPN